MRIVLAGATGFIGQTLCETLAASGHELAVLTRDPGRAERMLPAGARALEWRPDARALSAAATEAVSSADAVVNLAGESLGATRWTPDVKARLRASRLQSTAALVAGLQAAHEPAATLVNASAVGYYGDRGDDEATEEDPPGHDFLATLCADWEVEARKAPEGVRVVLARLGVVLGEQGGALPRMLTPFRLGVGGPLGSGRQWFSWVHRDDAVRMLTWALQTPGVVGPLNVTAPEPVTVRQLAAALGRALHRPAMLPVPGLALRLVLGEFADTLLAGQRVLPTVAQRLGFQWRYPRLDEALSEVVGRKPGRSAPPATG